MEFEFPGVWMLEFGVFQAVLASARIPFRWATSSNRKYLSPPAIGGEGLIILISMTCTGSKKTDSPKRKHDEVAHIHLPRALASHAPASANERHQPKEKLTLH